MKNQIILELERGIPVYDIHPPPPNPAHFHPAEFNEPLEEITGHLGLGRYSKGLERVKSGSEVK
jgi:hypothetical protein